jgi:predicted alpha/beta-fold hydrolase
MIRTVDLGDGDAVAVHDDTPEGWQPGGRVIVMAHGVSDDHGSPLLVRLKAKLNDRGVRVFRWDMRGCGAGRPLARRPYHAGCSGDLAKVVEAVVGWTAGPRGEPPELSLFGVSLGGNVLLKYLGEDPERVPDAVKQAIAVNPPIDLVTGVEAIGTGASRIYDRHLTRRLVARLEEWWRERPDAVRPAEGRRPRGLREFDDWYTAPAVGFRDALDYYRQSSAAQFIPAIRTPTSIIASKDDPLVPFAMFAADRVDYPSCVRLMATDAGGHVGFVGRSEGDPDSRWLDWRVVEMVSP